MSEKYGLIILVMARGCLVISTDGFFFFFGKKKQRNAQPLSHVQQPETVCCSEEFYFKLPLPICPMFVLLERFLSREQSNAVQNQ